MLTLVLLASVLIGTATSFERSLVPVLRQSVWMRKRCYDSVRFQTVPSVARRSSRVGWTAPLRQSNSEGSRGDEGESQEEEEKAELSSSAIPMNEEDQDWGIMGSPQSTNHRNTSLDVSASETTHAESTSPPTDFKKFSGISINGAAPLSTPTIWNSLGELTRLTRPVNFPGICLFHMLGVYLALDHVGQTSQYWRVLMADPTMWLVLSALILTSSTSMVVNDYYDCKLGRDSDPTRPLVNGTLPMPLVRCYVSYLYAACLVCVAFLPGVPARLSVVLALMLTYLYTKHLKPITWIKNLVCAVLIAFSPFTSASSAIFRTVGSESQNGTLIRVLSVPSLWRLVSILFVGFIGREMTMDLNDVEPDRAVGVLTVPVRYGRRFGSRFALLMSGMAVLLATVYPAIDLGMVVLGNHSANIAASVWIRLASTPRRIWRFLLALTGSSLLLRRSLQVYRTEGQNRDIVQQAVDEGLLSILFILASFV